MTARAARVTVVPVMTRILVGGERRLPGPAQGSASSTAPSGQPGSSVVCPRKVGGGGITDGIAVRHRRSVRDWRQSPPKPATPV